jgi:hypothetical protein
MELPQMSQIGSVNFLLCYSYRFNENNACRVVIDVSSFSIVEDGRVVYQKGKCLEWWVDLEEHSIIDMEKDVSKHFTWGKQSKEANFCFSNDIGRTTRLVTNQELLSLSWASNIVKFIMTIDRCVGNVSQLEDESQVIDGDNGLLVQVSDDGHLQQVTDKVVAAEYEGQEWVDEPKLRVTTIVLARVEEEEEEKEHYMDLGFDPDRDDPIRADEEWRYFKKQQKEKEMENRGKVYEYTNPDVVPSDESTMIRDDVYVAHTTYDKDSLEINNGSTFAHK